MCPEKYGTTERQAEGTADENVFGFHSVCEGFQRSFQINENEVRLARQIRNVEFLQSLVEDLAGFVIAFFGFF